MPSSNKEALGLETKADAAGENPAITARRIEYANWLSSAPTQLMMKALSDRRRALVEQAETLGFTGANPEMLKSILVESRLIRVLEMNIQLGVFVGLAPKEKETN